MKLTDRFRYESAFTIHYDIIMKNVIEVIQACEEGNSNQVLSHEEVLHLYTVLSTFSPDYAMDENGNKK